MTNFTKYAVVTLVAIASISPMFVYASTRPSSDELSLAPGYGSSYCGSLANGRSACRHGHTFSLPEPKVHAVRDTKMKKVPVQPPHLDLSLARVLKAR